MIIPNLMVTDMAASFAFYREALGLDLVMALNADRTALDESDGRGVIFAILAGQGGQLMLQECRSLRAELPSLQSVPQFTGTIYIRGLDPRTVQPKLAQACIIKPMERQWYGMLELYLRDPDGYIVCVACADGPPVV